MPEQTLLDLDYQKKREHQPSDAQPHTPENPPQTHGH